MSINESQNHQSESRTRRKPAKVKVIMVKAGPEPRKKHLRIPDNFRKEYMRAASRVWSDIADDCNQLEDWKPTKINIVEIIRDANRILTCVMCNIDSFTPAFVQWLGDNEYNQDYACDMDAAVWEVI